VKEIEETESEKTSSSRVPWQKVAQFYCNQRDMKEIQVIEVMTVK
jgi:hypothetical protein